MKKIALAVAVFLISSISVKAAHLSEMLSILRLSNDEAVVRILEYQKLSILVKSIQNGQHPNKNQLDQARSDCRLLLSFIATPKLRRKLLKQTMKDVDDEILEFAESFNDGFEAADGMAVSWRIQRRLLSLYEFQAERYQEFLLVLNSVQPKE